MMRTNTVIGFLGTQLDGGKSPDRWTRWRPTVALCQHEDWLVSRLDLIHDTRHASMAEFVAADIASVSPETQVRRHVLDFKDPWDFEEVFAGLHDFARDYAFRPEAEHYHVNMTTGTHVAQICMFLLAESRHIPGDLLQCSPPRKAHFGGPGQITSIDLNLARYDRLARRFAAEAAQATSFLKDGVATQNATFNGMIDQIEKVAIRSTAPILLLGPTGAGKSQLAKRIFALKQARHQVGGDFVEVNCATLRGDNAMSALFGHKKGAFTGAVSDRPGHLRAADKGILFLDEIGELGLDEQAMILRAIEEKRFFPLGADKEVGSDFQLIAGTNRDLGAEASAGRFRPDLFARLNLWTFTLPGLAERREDIAPNIDYELRKLSEAGQEVRFNGDALSAYLKFAAQRDALWSGNFRDLGASIQRMATLSEAGRITRGVVDGEILRLKRAWRPAVASDAEQALADVLGPAEVAALDRFDRAQLADVISVCRRSASLSAAGRELFAASRAKKTSSNDADRLRKYLARFDLNFDQIKWI